MGNIDDLNEYYQQVGNLTFSASSDSNSNVINSNILFNTSLFSFNNIDEITLYHYLNSINTKQLV